MIIYIAILALILIYQNNKNYMLLQQDLMGVKRRLKKINGGFNNMNKVILIGRLTKDIELHQTTSGTSVCTFSIAVDRRFKKEGEQTADFINIVSYGKTAEFTSKYFKKGQRIGVYGRLNTRKYEDKDGKTVYVTEVIADETYFCDGKESKNDIVPDGNIEDADLPF